MRRRRAEFFDYSSPYLDRFGFLLLLTAATIIVLALVRLHTQYTDVSGRLGELLATTLIGATVVLAMRSSGVARRRRLLAEILIALGIVLLVILVVVQTITGTTEPDSAEGTPFTAPIFITMLALISPLLVMRRLLQHRKVERATLMGAVAAYLMIPLAFFFIFLTIDEFQTASFFGQAQPTTTFMYFSLATVTTVGYGDYTATTELGHLAAVTEAVLGQVYLVTFVAILVGLRVQAGRQDSPDPAALARSGDQ